MYGRRGISVLNATLADDPNMEDKSELALVTEARERTQKMIQGLKHPNTGTGKRVVACALARINAGPPLPGVRRRWLLLPSSAMRGGRAFLF